MFPSIPKRGALGEQVAVDLYPGVSGNISPTLHHVPLAAQTLQLEPYPPRPISVPLGIEIYSLHYDGANYWTVNSYGILKFSPTFEILLRLPPITTLAGYISPRMITALGFLWILDYNYLYKLDPTTGEVVGRALYSDSFNAFGIAFDGANLWVVVNNTNTVVKINPTSLAITATVTVGAGCTDCVFAAGFLWVTNFSANTVSKVNVTTNTVVATVTSVTGANYAGTDGTDIWVTGSSSSLRRISSSSNTVVATIPSVGGTPPFFSGTHIYTGVSGNLYKIDIATNTPTTIPIPGASLGSVANVVWNGAEVVVPTIGSLLSAQQLVKVDPATNAIITTTTVGRPITGGCYDGQKLWLASIVNNKLLTYNVKTGILREATSTGSQPRGMAFDRTHVWVCNSNDGTVSKVNAATEAVESVITVGTSPWEVAASADDIWVTNKGSSSVSRINKLTGVVTNIPVPAQPTCILFDGLSVWVTVDTGAPNALEYIRISLSDNTVTSFNILPSNNTSIANGIGFDGRFLFISESIVPQAFQIDPRSGSRVGTSIALMGGGSNTSRSFVFDGDYIWSASTVSGNVHGFKATRVSSTLLTYTDFPPINQVHHLVFDGCYVYVLQSSPGGALHLFPVR